VAVLLAVFAAPFASSAPDGLERVAMDKGFAAKAAAEPAWSHAPAADYSAPGVHGGVSTAVAGCAGTLITFGAAWGLAKWAARRRKEAESESEP
jgi:cobalt/nickel transport protein